ncbi:hypothetical protein POM88_014486 [Heracleum sosnowskyi]|uniref:Uncharacterized protein n=1 Tax=Heracleum sosnowskyi TaxID=360622 RepID=A0AAD8MZ06_9APIA|nr:hypothetical protein POM88_014486 [Heracleum sosnowskyi]
MDISSGALQRSSRLEQLSASKVTVTEEVDQITVEENESHDHGESTESDIEKTPPRVNERLVEVEEVRNVQFSSLVRYIFKGVEENQPAEKKTKWKRKTAQQEKQNEEKKRRKPNVKYPTKKASYAKVDNDEEIKPARHINRAKEHVKIRNSPRLLSEMLYFLTEEQKQWVRRSGFGELLGFELEMLPGPFAYNILQIFEHNSVSLRLSNGEIIITEEDVSDVLGTSTNAYVDVKILRFDDDLDRLSEYNWAEYLLNSLVAAVQSWNRSSSVFFNGSLIFLILLYVDRVRHKGIKLVERQTPSYKGWTVDKLKERQAIELFSGKFGVGSILPALRDLSANSKNKMKNNDVDENAEHCNEYHHYERDAQDWNNYEQGQYEYAHDNAEQRPTNNVVEKLRLRAQDLMAVKDKFFEDLKEAKEKYGDDVNLLSIEQVMNEVFHPSTTNGAELVVMNEQEQNPSTTNKKKLKDIPSFSLGIENNVITQVCNDIKKVETAGDIEEEDAQDVDGEDDDDFVSPIPIVRGKSRRLVKFLYVDRVRHKGIKLVERQTPSYKGWIIDKLKERQAIELFSEKFRVGSILLALRDLPANSKNKMKNAEHCNEYHHYERNAQDWNNYEQGQYEYAHDNAEQRPTNVLIKLIQHKLL